LRKLKINTRTNPNNEVNLRLNVVDQRT